MAEIVFETAFKHASVPAAAKAVMIELPAAFRMGRLHRVMVKQTGVGGGGLDGFTVDVYNTDRIYPPDGATGADLAYKELRRIIPQQTVAGSADTLNYRSEAGHPYVNMDDNPAGKLYVYIDPGSTGDKPFSITLTVSRLSP